jgi:hypothetical protein
MPQVAPKPLYRLSLIVDAPMYDGEGESTFMLKATTDGAARREARGIIKSYDKSDGLIVKKRTLQKGAMTEVTDIRHVFKPQQRIFITPRRK